MYLDHFNLTDKPFDLSPGPRFFWLGEKHTEALAALKYAITENQGFLLLTGDVGVGKTALIHRLIQDLDHSTIIANIPDPGLEALDFFNILASEFHMARKFHSKGEFLIELKKFLRKTHAVQKNVLLIIDEAQRLNDDILEQVRLLSNIEMSDRKLINIFFVGQPEFGDLLMDPRNRAVRQRIVISFHFGSLSERDCDHYIRHRLRVAGATRDIFSPAAIAEIYRFSRGCPRLINIVCDHALLCAYAAGVTSIGAEVIEECERDLSIPAGLRPQEAKSLPGPPDPMWSAVAEPPLRRSRTRSRFAVTSLIGILGLLGLYLLFYSGFGTTLFFHQQAAQAPAPPLPTEQTTPPPVRTAPAEVKNVPPPAVGPAVPETAVAPPDRAPDRVGLDLQRPPYDIVDRTLTIASEPNPAAADNLPAVVDNSATVFAPGGRSDQTTGSEKGVGAGLKPTLEPAGQRREEKAPLDIGDSSADQIRRLVAEIEASRLPAAKPEKEMTPNQEIRKELPADKKELLPAAGTAQMDARPVGSTSPKPAATPLPVPTAVVSPPPAPTAVAEPLRNQKTPAAPAPVRADAA
ncbi:MAG: AAA family ATPase, partial [Desulfobacterales bacterium]